MNPLCARGEDAASYTERNHSKEAEIEGRREDKREARYWTGRGGSKSRRVMRFNTTMAR